MNNSFTTNEQLMHMAKKYDIPLNAVYMKDELKDITPLPGGYIINMQDSVDGNGTHWVAVYNPRNYNDSLYFDSFGIDPPVAIIEFMQKYSPNMIASDKEIQNINSGFCGQYCLYFLHQMFHNKGDIVKKYDRFIKTFKDNLLDETHT